MEGLLAGCPIRKQSDMAVLAPLRAPCHRGWLANDGVAISLLFM